MAIRSPAPSSVASKIVFKRSWATSLRLMSLAYSKYAYARVALRPTRAAQLIQLRQPEAMRAVDDERVGVGDVQARLDDRRAHQHVELAFGEREHRLLELVLGHLAMRDGDPRLGHQLVASGWRWFRCPARGC